MGRLQLCLAALLALGACAATPTLPTPANPAFAPLEARIHAGEFGNVHALLVDRSGQLIEEAYFPGEDEKRGFPLGRVDFTADTMHDARSISKTVVALLYGIALAEGIVPALDQPAITSFPELAQVRTPAIDRIQIGHFLTMTSGFAWDEFTFPYQDPRNSERMMDAAPDPYRYVFTQPIVHEPGAQWAYSGGDVAIVAKIIERGAGVGLDVYAQRALFAPLGITPSEWLKDARGVPFAASGLRLRPRDFVTLGRLIAQRGAWRGKQIAPAAWIDAMIAPHATVGGEPPCGMRYGYFTWLTSICAEGAAPIAIAAGLGYGGQRLVVVPAQDLVIVTHAGNYADRAQGEKANALIAAALRLAQP